MFDAQQVVQDPAVHNFLVQLGAAPVVVMAIQAMKNSKLFPWITKETENMKYFVGFLGALLTTMNVHGNLVGSVLWGATLTVHFSMAAVVMGLWHTANTWATQQMVFKLHQKISN